MNVEKIAQLCHEVNKAYCESIGDFSQLSWEDAQDWQKESAVNGVKIHMENEASPEQTHINWCKDKIADGWIYGEVKDPERKIHPCLVVYNQLPQEQRSKGYLFKAICDFFKKQEKSNEIVVNVVANISNKEEIEQYIDKLKYELSNLKVNLTL